MWCAWCGRRSTRTSGTGRTSRRRATVAGRTVTADVVAREAGVVAGLPVALAVFEPARGLPRRSRRGRVRDDGGYFGPDGGTLYPTSLAAGPRGAGPQATVTALVADGIRVVPGDAVLRVSGDAVVVLGAERTILNFVTHLSGIASATREWADALAGTGAVVRDTRKTLPGLRSLEKYAVRCGGGENHRMALGDAALVKDNHVAAAGGGGDRGARGARGGTSRAGDRGRVRLRGPGPRGARGGGAVHPARQHAGADLARGRGGGAGPTTGCGSRRAEACGWPTRARSRRPASTTCRSAP